MSAQTVVDVVCYLVVMPLATIALMVILAIEGWRR